MLIHLLLYFNIQICLFYAILQTIFVFASKILADNYLLNNKFVEHSTINFFYIVFYL